ncbi:hypothetical protein [Psychrobacter sp.]|uniref:hypothetical protein n=1 Tax=Psychrobacter sp. TaxID=56811 RepID=UPI003BB177FE
MSTGNPRNSMSAMRGTFRQASRSIRPVHLIIGLILCAFIIALVWWFRNNFEQVTTTDYALNTEAQYNPYYAAELLINSQYSAAIDADVEFDDEIAFTLLDSDLKTLLDELPLMDMDTAAIADGYRPTLIINSMGTKLTDERFEAFKSWIEQGGHLITFAARDSSYDDMQNALERLETLQQEQATPERISNDEMLNGLLEPLDSGNEFLNKLGIFRVENDQDSDVDTEGNVAEIEVIIEDSQKKINQVNNESLSIEDQIAELAKLQPLSLIDTSAYDTDLQQLLLIEIWHSQNRLNSQLFQSLYPDSAQINVQAFNNNNSTNQQTLKQQAQLIRQYIKASNINLSGSTVKNETSVEDKDSVVSDGNTSNNTSNNASDDAKKNGKSSALKKSAKEQLPELLTAILALSDEQLVALFYPTDSIYLDASFGKGRLSVINDSDVFSNPNPNLELSDEARTYDANSDTEQADSAPSSALYKLLTTESSIPSSLLSADNAAWLIALTQDSSDVQILPNTDIDSLPVILWKQARPALLGLGLLAFLWLWSLYNRFGKMAHLPTNQSRDIMRYFRQVGRFGWHQDNAQQLTQATRDKVRLLISEISNSSINTASLNDVNTVNTAANIDDQLSITKLHELLSARLDDKKRQLLHSISVSDHASHVSNINDDSNDSLLLTNEAFIRETIAPDRLQSAIDSRLQNSNQAFEFTQMTQTLWMIQWLLK